MCGEILFHSDIQLPPGQSEIIYERVRVFNFIL